MSARGPELSVTAGDCIEAMAAMPAASVDAIVTDPPYGLEFMGKEWDGADGFRRSLNGADVGRDDPFGRSSRTSPEYRAGKLFQRWCEQWAREALRVLKPGGHLLAFGGTRTAHRLACAIEDAGFEIRDTIAWLYGSGFPKSLDVSKAIDKAAGVEGTYGEPKSAAHGGWIERGAMRGHEGHEGYQRPWMADSSAVDRNARRYAPATPDAEHWAGWGTALKPAHEPIVVARRPLTGTVAANILAHGTGALNVDGCRIGTGDDLNGGAYTVGARKRSDGWVTQRAGDENAMRNGAAGAYAAPSGRWPANVCLDEQAARALDEMTGTLTSGANPTRRGSDKFRMAYGDFEGQRMCEPARGSDSGGASRFLYVAKASSAERSAGLDGFEAKPLRPDGAAFGEMTMWNGQNGDERWRAKNPNHPRANVHPTVKPIALMRWLVRLVTPPGGTVLDPFTGSGTTGIAAALEGFDFIGVEREAEYVAIAQARIAWWARHPDGMTLVKRLEAEAEQAATAAAGQGSLFDVPDAPSTSSNGRDGEASADRQYADRGASNFAMKPGRRR